MGDMDSLAPILQFDPAQEAMIEPSRVLGPLDMPEHAVACFFQDVIAKVCRTPGVEIYSELRAEHGAHPIYALQVDGRSVAVFHPGVGAPLAAGFLEEVIALGCSKFIACGGAGALVPELTLGHLVIPTSAVRDEGTSYHYLPPGELARPTPEAVEALEATLRQEAVPYVTGATWTTDGIYRETPAKVSRRREEGCLTVEMEAAAFFAVARFRKVTFAQVLYAADSLAGEQWDNRDWLNASHAREALFWVAVDACLRL